MHLSFQSTWIEKSILILILMTCTIQTLSGVTSMTLLHHQMKVYSPLIHIPLPSSPSNPFILHPLQDWMLPDVGGITVCYGTHLHSPVSWVRSYHQYCIIFGFSFYIQNSAKILVELEIWHFNSDPSLIVDVFVDQDYSGDSNGGICVIIPALGDEN